MQSTSFDKIKYILLVILVLLTSLSLYLYSISNTTPSSPSFRSSLQTNTICVSSFSSGHSNTRLVRLAKTSTEPAFLMALHPVGDLISDRIIEKGSWAGPAGKRLADLISAYTNYSVITAGANIGSLALHLASLGFQVRPHSLCCALCAGCAAAGVPLYLCLCCWPADAGRVSWLWQQGNNRGRLPRDTGKLHPVLRVLLVPVLVLLSMR